MPVAEATGAAKSPLGPPVVALVGPTASGKSEVAHQVALASMTGSSAGGQTGGMSPVGVELVSVDSMAVYRGMDIGTTKPTPAQRATVPYHLIDLVDASEEFTVQQFQSHGRRALRGIAGRDRGALLVGGAGLYLRSLVDDLRFPGRYPEVAASLEDGLEAAGPEGSEPAVTALAALHDRLTALDPVAAGRIEPTNRRRLVRALEVTIGSGSPFSSFGPGLDRYPTNSVSLVGISRHQADLDRRVAERFGRLMDRGFLEEVRSLAARPGAMSRTARQALGYRELLTHLEHGVPLDDAVAEAIRRTRLFARRQLAWFRRDPRIVWLDPDDDPVRAIVARFGAVPRDGAMVGDCPSPQ
jgi:tRNA dimethylallyltransferase